MKYLFITSYNTDYAYNAFQRLAKYLSLENDVIFIHRAKRDSESKNMLGFRSFVNLKPVLEKQSHFINTIITLKLFIYVVRSLLFDKLDFIYVADRLSLICTWICLIKPIKIVFWNFEYAPPELYRFSMIFKFIVKRLYLYIDVDPNRLNLFKKDWGYTGQSIVIPNTTDPIPTAKIDREYILTKYGLPIDKKIVLYSGGILRQSLDLIYDSFSKVTFPSAILVMFLSASNDKIDEELRKVKKTSAQNRIYIYNPISREELFLIMKSVDIAIMFYDHHKEHTLNYMNINYMYCNPSKVYDYLSAGLPIVSSDNPSMIELLQENQAGICCNPHNSKNVAEVIDKLLEDHDLRNIMAKNALHLFEEHTFSKYYFKYKSIL